MVDYEKLKNLGFSQYEIACYLTLVARHPLNGSQTSRFSGIARSRVYDVLRNMVRKGFALEVGRGRYVPLPPEELYKHLQREFNEGLDTLKEKLDGHCADLSYEFIWMIRGYDRVITRAKEMIAAARSEIYVRLFPPAAQRLHTDLINAAQRGVGIRYIAMGDLPSSVDIQVTHPGTEDLIKTIGGRSFDLITDRSEALVGIFEDGREDGSPINWTRNRWFVIANRDSLRHDFYHCFLDKIIEKGEMLSARERQIYEIIKADN
jgi:sugar-specific transcriptional regulator TrmB